MSYWKVSLSASEGKVLAGAIRAMGESPERDRILMKLVNAKRRAEKVRRHRVVNMNGYQLLSNPAAAGRGRRASLSSGRANPR
jgi:hypothetical protein